MIFKCEYTSLFFFFFHCSFQYRIEWFDNRDITNETSSMIHLELYFADSFSFLLFTSDYVKGDDLIVIDLITRRFVY